MIHYAHISWGRTSMIELVRYLRVIYVLAKFENDPWKIMDVRVLTGLVCPVARPPARPLGRRQYPGALKGCGVKTLIPNYRVAKLLLWPLWLCNSALYVLNHLTWYQMKGENYSYHISTKFKPNDHRMTNYCHFSDHTPKSISVVKICIFHCFSVDRW